MQEGDGLRGLACEGRGRGRPWSSSHSSSPRLPQARRTEAHFVREQRRAVPAPVPEEPVQPLELVRVQAETRDGRRRALRRYAHGPGGHAVRGRLHDLRETRLARTAEARKGADEVRALLWKHSSLAADEERSLTRAQLGCRCPFCSCLRRKLVALKLGKVCECSRVSPGVVLPVVVVVAGVAPASSAPLGEEDVGRRRRSDVAGATGAAALAAAAAATTAGAALDGRGRSPELDALHPRGVAEARLPSPRLRYSDVVGHRLAQPELADKVVVPDVRTRLPRALVLREGGGTVQATSGQRQPHGGLT